MQREATKKSQGHYLPTPSPQLRSVSVMCVRVCERCKQCAWLPALWLKLRPSHTNTDTRTQEITNTRKKSKNKHQGFIVYLKLYLMFIQANVHSSTLSPQCVNADVKYLEKVAKAAKQY